VGGASSCRSVCDAMTRCVGYADTPCSPSCRCRIASEEAPPATLVLTGGYGTDNRTAYLANLGVNRGVAVQWIAIPGNQLAQTDGPSVSGSSGETTTYSAYDPTYTCRRKDTPLLIHETIGWSTSSAILLLVAGSIMAAGSLCGCMMQYSLVTRRQGAKGAGALFSKMLCFGACAKAESDKSGRFGELDQEAAAE